MFRITIENIGFLMSDCSFNESDIILKNIFRFIVGFIQQDVQYGLKFNLCFDVDAGRSFEYIIKLKDNSEFNRFITSDYESVLSRLNFNIDDMKRYYKGCELTGVYVKLERYGYLQN